MELNEDLNVLVGKNNSGKSNVTDALVLLSHMMQGRNIRDVFSDYGGYSDIVLDKNAKDGITFNLEFAFSEEDGRYRLRP